MLSPPPGVASGLPRSVLRVLAGLAPHSDLLQWRVASGDQHVTLELTWRFPDARHPDGGRPPTLWGRLRRSLTISPARPAPGSVPEGVRRLLRDVSGQKRREWRRSCGGGGAEWRRLSLRASLGGGTCSGGGITPAGSRRNSWPRQPAATPRPTAHGPHHNHVAATVVGNTPDTEPVMVTSTPRRDTSPRTPARLTYRHRDDIGASLELLARALREESGRALDTIRREWRRSVRDWPPRTDTSSTDSETSTAAATAAAAAGATTAAAGATTGNGRPTTTAAAATATTTVRRHIDFSDSDTHNSTLIL